MTTSPLPAHDQHEHDETPPDPRAPSAPAEWDELYSGSDRVWSGSPNGALVAEAGALPPGRALDVGCGEGADAIWLARRGWQVTALDVSRVALDRAARAARASGVTVGWVCAGLLEAGLPSGGFDLVSVFYPALLRTPGADAERALLDAVAPGGTLLLVHHADMDARRAEDAADVHDSAGCSGGSTASREHGFDPEDYVGPARVAARLGDGWEVLVDERRPRDVPPGPGAHHTHDLVLRARRAA